MKRMTLLVLSGVFAVLLSGFGSGCSVESYSRAAELNAVRNFEMDGEVVGGVPYLIVRGRCSRSGDVCEGARLIKKGRTRHLVVYLSSLGRSSRPETFEERIELTDVDEVYFGNARSLVWRRPGSGAKRR